VGAVVASLLAAGLIAGGRLRWVAGGPAAPTVAAGAAAPLQTPRPRAAADVAPIDRVTVLLQSTPSGAEILDERGHQIGFTPHDLVLPRGGEREVHFRMSGFRPVDRRFQARTDATIAVRMDPEARVGVRAGHPPGRRGPSAGAGLDSTATTIDPFAR